MRKTVESVGEESVRTFLLRKEIILTGRPLNEVDAIVARSPHKAPGNGPNGLAFQICGAWGCDRNRWVHPPEAGTLTQQAAVQNRVCARSMRALQERGGLKERNVI